ncbi:MAG TPA: hypothetical protein VIV66_15080 [Pyrinomonadaceae bacterium]
MQVNPIVRSPHNVRLLILTVLSLLVFGCATKPRRIVEAPPAFQPPPAAELAEMPKLPAKLNEVQEAVKRVFKDAALVDQSREPSFVAGDFNGDHSQDIAVVLKPVAEKIADMNQEFPPWILRDPFSRGQLTTSLHIDADDVLLAVIHGYGTNDWRDPQATQTFLLKNSAGLNLEVHKGKDFLAANVGRKIPRTQGDLIREIVHGSSGYLYYSGPTYSWYDPKTFKGEPELKLVHPGMAARAGN